MQTLRSGSFWGSEPCLLLPRLACDWTEMPFCSPVRGTSEEESEQEKVWANETLPYTYVSLASRSAFIDALNVHSLQKRYCWMSQVLWDS